VKIASAGWSGSARPSPSAAYARQVAGMNCIQPIAPALDTLRLRPKEVSTRLIAASTDQGTPYVRAAER